MKKSIAIAALMLCATMVNAADVNSMSDAEVMNEIKSYLPPGAEVMNVTPDQARRLLMKRRRMQDFGGPMVSQPTKATPTQAVGDLTPAKEAKTTKEQTAQLPQLEPANIADRKEGVDLTEKIESIFLKFETAGLLNGKVRVSVENVSWLRIGQLNADGKPMMLPTSKKLALKLKYSLFGEDDLVMAAPALSELVGGITDICEQVKGKIEYNRPEMSPDRGLFKTMRDLKDKSLYGSYLCRVDGDFQYLVNVSPDEGVDRGVWRITASMVSKRQVDERNKAKQDRVNQREEFLSRISAGDKVSVPSHLLPDSVIDGANPQVVTSTRKEKKFHLCGLVVDVKGSLAQVQVGQGLMYIQKNELYPFVTKWDSSGMALELGDWTRKCF